MRLMCNVNNEDCDVCYYADVEISKKQAKQLLELRAVWEELQKKHPSLSSLYRIETFDKFVKWLDSTDSGLEDEYYDEDLFAADGWINWPDDAQATPTEFDLTAETMSITRGGVFWSAEAKHGYERFVTPELPWSQLEAIAKTTNRPGKGRKKETL